MKMVQELALREQMKNSFSHQRSLLYHLRNSLQIFKPLSSMVNIAWAAKVTLA